jgi:hypothetical protein
MPPDGVFHVVLKQTAEAEVLAVFAWPWPMDAIVFG